MEVGARRYQGARILLVEDDPDIRASLAEVLAGAAYAVTAAPNGLRALEILRTAARPDLIVLDLMMPVMNGWEFRIAQRRESTFARIPVIALSADRSPEALAIDAEAYLPKPIDIDRLLGTIERVLGDMEAARLTAADRLAALGTLAAGIAHEINNPLTYVIANLQVLAESLTAPPEARRNDELQELIADALMGADRIRQIVSRVQAASVAQRPDQPGRVDLRAAIEAALSILTNDLRCRARIDLACLGAPQVNGDRVRLEQVFINLLTNAAHAISERDAADQEIHVVVRIVGERALVEISDNGHGIAPEVRNRIFHPFFTTKPVGVGSGLGLAVSRSIVEALAGEITFDSEVGRGSTFRVSLPIAAAA